MFSEYRFCHCVISFVFIDREATSEFFYTTLEFFQSDWLNEVWSLRQDVHDDYRFVYMGPNGTWLA